MMTRCLTSGDAYLEFDADQLEWWFGTALIEQRLQLDDGRLRCVALMNKRAGSNLVQGADSDEFYFTLGAQEFSGLKGGYTLVDYKAASLPVPKASPGIEPGICFTLVLANRIFQLALRYDIYASTPRTEMGFIRKVYTITNLTADRLPLSHISLQQLRLAPEYIDRLSICYWQGGGADAGTNEMRVEPPYHSLGRTFNSLAGMPGYRIDDIYDGSASYHPYFVFDDAAHQEGLFIGHNYLGPWSAQMLNAQQPVLPGQDRRVIRHCYYINAQLEMHTEPLAPGASFEVPNSFLGVYTGDLDSAAEQLHDWQSTHKWDYTRERYLFGSGIYNSNWNSREHRCNTERRKEDMWRIANLCRSVGAHIAHEDDFWFDERGRGDWEGIEWGELVSYLSRSGISFKLWMPPQHVDPGTTLDREHPDWHPQTLNPRRITSWYGHGFCTACQPAHDHMREFILARQRRYGPFIHRFDGWVQSPCFSTEHDHPAGQPFVQQYRHYLRMMREVKDADPLMGLEGCNSGGEWCDWDKLELVEHNQSSDGGGPDDRYYLSYFWPPAKEISLGGGGGHSLDPDWIIRQRKAILLQRYLVAKGVIGRYMRVYHPLAEGAPDAHTFIQVMNSERSRGVIQADKSCEGALVFPKRLLPELVYSICDEDGVVQYQASGADLMAQGIRFTAGGRSNIYLNLTDLPGAGTDAVPPSQPRLTLCRQENIWGHTGVALEWTPSSDDGILAGYEIWRGSKLIDFVAIGTFYFDCAEGCDPGAAYRVVAVDGDGNRSG